MKLKLYYVVLMSLFCSGCETLEGFINQRKAVPIVTAAKPQVETETVWVPAETRKMWVNAYIDDDGNMIDGHYKYVILEAGHWALQEIAAEEPDQIVQKTIEEEINNE